MTDNTFEELDGSELGTKEYWDKSYKTEIQNYKNHGDVGEVWFDEDSQIRIINYMLKRATIQPDDRFIDLGSGNGMLLIELAREGFKNLLGVDYSEGAVSLSSEIAKDQELDKFIQYKVVDLLSDEEMSALGQFQIIHDKGTYDAISLHPDDPKTKRTTYLNNVRKLLNDGGIFIITSCNWTQSELVESFAGFFDLDAIIPTPTFKFGGTVGNVVTSLVFKTAENKN